MFLTIIEVCNNNLHLGLQMFLFCLQLHKMIFEFLWRKRSVKERKFLNKMSRHKRWRKIKITVDT